MQLNEVQQQQQQQQQQTQIQTEVFATYDVRRGPSGFSACVFWFSLTCSFIHFLFVFLFVVSSLCRSIITFCFSECHPCSDCDGGCDEFILTIFFLFLTCFFFFCLLSFIVSSFFFLLFSNVHSLFRPLLIDFVSFIPFCCYRVSVEETAQNLISLCERCVWTRLSFFFRFFFWNERSDNSVIRVSSVCWEHFFLSFLFPCFFLFFCFVFLSVLSTLSWQRRRICSRISFFSIRSEFIYFELFLPLFFFLIFVFVFLSVLSTLGAQPLFLLYSVRIDFLLFCLSFFFFFSFFLSFSFLYSLSPFLFLFFLLFLFSAFLLLFGPVPIHFALFLPLLFIISLFACCFRSSLCF